MVLTLGLALTPLELSPKLPDSSFLDTDPTGGAQMVPNLVGMSLGRMVPVWDGACVLVQVNVLVVLGAEEKGAMLESRLLSVINDSAVHGAELELEPEVEVGVAFLATVSAGCVLRGVEDDGSGDNGGEMGGVEER